MFGMSYSTGRLLIPSFSEVSDEWTIFVFFESNIENVNFIIPNGAVAKQKDR